MKLENSIYKLIHGVKCYVFSLEHIIEWHLDVATIVLYLFFKSQLLQLERQTKIINLVPLALLATKCQNSQELIKSRSNFKAKCRFGSFLHVGLYWIGGRSRPSYLFRKGFLFNGIGFLDSALDGFIGQTARSLPLSPDQRTPVPQYSAFSEHYQVTGHNINPHNVKVYLTKTTPSRAEWRRPLLLNKGNPPPDMAKDWTYRQFTILATLMKSEWFGRNIRFVPYFFRSEFWNFLH